MGILNKKTNFVNKQTSIENNYEYSLQKTNFVNKKNSIKNNDEYS